MSDEIKAAVTKEEWACGLVSVRTGTRHNDLGVGVRPGTKTLEIRMDNQSHLLPLDEVRLAGLAAVCLNESAIGFTHEDVDEVRAWADYADNGRRADRLRSLAARIAALLPPRSTVAAKEEE